MGMDISLVPLLAMGPSEDSIGYGPPDLWGISQPLIPRSLSTQCLCGFQAACGKAAAFCGKRIMLTLAPAGKNYQTCLCKSPDSAKPRGGERRNRGLDDWKWETRKDKFTIWPSSFTLQPLLEHFDCVSESCRDKVSLVPEKGTRTLEEIRHRCCRPRPERHRHGDSRSRVPGSGGKGAATFFVYASRGANRHSTRHLPAARAPRPLHWQARRRCRWAIPTGEPAE